jgi:MoaA/NifB/PqqE/SkfB family radical SAM enzyme
VSYHGRIKRTLREQALLHGVMLELTYRCNLDCFFCYNDRQLTGRPLALEDYRSLLADLAAMRVLFVSLTGGEPLVHPHFFDIGRAARELGFAIRVKTGAHGLRGRVARRLKEEVDPLQTEISLHGATAATHDRQTRVPGSFEKLMAAMPEILDLGLRPAFVSTLTAWNEHEVGAMFALADGLGVRLRFQGPVGPRDDGDRAPLSIQPSAAGWERIVALAAERQEASPTALECGPPAEEGAAGAKPHCGVGSEEILIDPYGSVFPCLHLRWPAGNVHERPIEEIWRSHVFRDALKLSYDSAARIRREGPLSILGAPLYCPGLEAKGCACTVSGAGLGLRGEWPEKTGAGVL